MVRLVLMMAAGGYVWHQIEQHGNSLNPHNLSAGETIGFVAAALTFAIAAVVRLPERRKSARLRSGFFIE